MSRGWPSPDQVMELLDELKQAGYNIGADQYIAAQDLLLALVAQRESPDLERLKSLLRPLVCGSPTEQDEFHTHFNRWIDQPTLSSVGKWHSTEAQDLRQELKGAQRQWRWLRWVIGFGCFILILSIYLVLSNIFRPPVVEVVTGGGDPIPIPVVSSTPGVSTTPTSTPIVSPTPELSTLTPVSIEQCPPPQLTPAYDIPRTLSLVTGGFDDSGSLQLWGQEGNLIASVQDHTGFVRAVARHPQGTFPNGAQFISGDESGVIQFWTTSGRLISTWDGLDPVLGLAVSSSSQIVGGNEDGTVRLWTPNGTLIRTFSGHIAPVRLVAITPDGSRIASGSEDGTARVWDANTGEEIGVFEHGGRVVGLALSRDGSLLATGQPRQTPAQVGALPGRSMVPDPSNPLNDWIGGSPAWAQSAPPPFSTSTATLWGVETGDLLAEMDAGNGVQALAFSPDGSDLVTGEFNLGGTDIIRRWDLEGTLLTTMEGHTSTINLLDFSPDGSVLISGDQDGNLRFWSQQGQLLDQLTLQGPVRSIHFAREQDLNPRTLLGIALLIPLPMVLIGGWWWNRRAQRFLRRRSTSEQPDLDTLSFQGLDEDLFPPVPLLRLAQGFRRRSKIRSQQLNVEGTVQETVRQAGWFTPVYGYRQALPEYLVLIDQLTPTDHQSRFIAEMMQRLVQNGVFITVYTFKEDPRICFPFRGPGSPRPLKEILSHHLHHRLVIFSDVEGLFSPYTGELEPWTEVLTQWPERAVLTPEPSQNWGYPEQELAQHLTVLPATLEGLGEFIRTLELGRSGYEPSSATKHPLPSTLRDRPRRWLERVPPQALSVDPMLSSLHQYLGEDGMVWLRACAIFPELNWSLTVYLGHELKPPPDRSLLAPGLLMDLVRLPWFRYGFMPDWLRVRLISGMTAAQEQAVRQALEDLLVTAIQGSVGAFQLEVARKHPNEVRELADPLLRWFAKRAEKDSPLRDRIFLDFMAGRRPELAVPLPRGAQLRFPTPGVTRHRFLQIMGASLAGCGVYLLFPEFEQTLLRSPERIVGNLVKFNVVTVDRRGREVEQARYQNEFRTVDLGDGVSLDLLRIPSGCFIMGSPESEEGRDSDEGPQRQVTIAEPFWMGKYQVTQAQWRAVAALPQVQIELDPDPSNFKGEDRPVEQVSWDEAVEFCARLSMLTGRDYRLPSEAEWEYACRAGTTTPFHFGETITTDLANYRGTDDESFGWSGSYGEGPKGIYRQETTPVGSFGVANAFGLYDMHGNVWEWCADPWHENYENAPIDGRIWEEGGNTNRRLLRGGSWNNVPGACRSANRGSDTPDNRKPIIGFRVCCGPPR